MVKMAYAVVLSAPRFDFATRFVGESVVRICGG